MPKLCKWKCCICKDELSPYKVFVSKKGDYYCRQCFNVFLEKGENVVMETKEYNEPEHYHIHDMDTIEFLKRGFPPEVFMSFALGHIIKYAQRAKYKNGREDYVKMVDYAKRALDWYDETEKTPQ